MDVQENQWTKRRLIVSGVGMALTMTLAGCIENSDGENEDDEPEVEVGGNAGTSAE